MARSARFTATITTDATGITNSAFFNRFVSPPAIDPITRELTARPNHPELIAIPDAVAVIVGNRSATIARTVGNMGAIANPARNTATPAAAVVRNIQKVVMAIRTAATSVT